jgi:GT2 family glycosyltransferase
VTGAPAVAIVVLSWNGLNDTVECLESLRALTYPHYRVIVVDNGSEDGSPGEIRRRFPEVTLIENEINLGFVGGNNVGMAYALEAGFPLILLLNNDTHLAPDCLAELVAVAVSDAAIGVVGPLMQRVFDPEIIDMGGDFNFWTGTVNLRRVLPGPILPPAMQIDYVWGCGFLVKAEVIHAIGMFDPRYGAYYEDGVFCLKARAHGWRTVVATRAWMWHKIGRSGEKRFLWQSWMRIRNHVLFFLQHARPIQYLTLVPCLAFYHVPMLIFRILRLFAARKIMHRYRDRPITLWYRRQPG